MKTEVAAMARSVLSRVTISHEDRNVGLSVNLDYNEFSLFYQFMSDVAGHALEDLVPRKCDHPCVNRDNINVCRQKCLLWRS